MRKLAAALMIAVLLAPAEVRDPPAHGIKMAGIALQNADLADYKSRLFTLIARFKRTQTTAADVEGILGMRFPDVSNLARPGFIVRTAASYKSLKLHHRITMYVGNAYGPLQHQGKPYTQYWLDFGELSQQPQMAMFADEARCLTVSELQAALAGAGLAYTTRLYNLDPDEDAAGRRNNFFIDVEKPDIISPGGIFIEAAVLRRPSILRPGQKIDTTRGCISSVGID